MPSILKSPFLQTLRVGVFAIVILALTGCGVKSTVFSGNYTSAITLQGQVFAGRNYMAGAVVKIYVTQPNGVATNGVYLGNAKLLGTVTANTTGGWSLTNLSCSSPDQVYVTAEGGTPYPSAALTTSLSNNQNSLMMTAIGDCSLLSSNGASNNVTTIVTNEASTVAAVWALNRFLSINGTTVNITSSASNYAGTNGVGTVGNYAGLAHAFLNANNLSPYKLGAFQQYTNGAATGAGGGLVPVQELNSLAYAQYLCTIGGSAGANDFSYCTTLYQLATPSGGSAPTNSLAAMLNIARNPSNNATAILNFTQTPIPYTNQTTSQQINAGVYVPALTALTPSIDWSAAIYYLPGYGVTTTGQGSIYPQFVAIDANDNAYFSNPSGSTSTAGNVVALTSNGQSLWTSATDSTNLTTPRMIAADALGHVWVANGGTSTAASFVQEIDASSGNMLQRYPSTATSLFGIAVDPLGNIWYGSTATTTQNLHELQRSGSNYSEATLAPVPLSTKSAPYQIRTDNNANIWVSGYNATAPQSLLLPNTGTASAPAYTSGMKSFTLGGTGGYGIVPDNKGNAYTATNGSGAGVYKVVVSGSGTTSTLSATNSASNTAASAELMEMDGTGSVWYLDNTTGTYLYQYTPSTGTINTYYPCYNAGTTTGTGTATQTVQTCATGMSTKADLAIDATGSIWVASYGNSGGGRMVQIIGIASPSVPLHALGQQGVMP